MKKQILAWFKRQVSVGAIKTQSHKASIATAALCVGLLGTNVAHAYLAAPYTADVYTLHLWHLDETTTPCVDSVASGGTNLAGLATGATLGTASYVNGTNSFGNALNTAAGGATKGDLLSASPTAANVTISLADPTTGAFTFEALVQIGFDPTASSTATYQIMSGESGTTANRIFQWRLVQKGFTLIAGVTSTVPCMTFENIRAGVASQNTIYAPLPTTGPDAIVSNGWYHVAVTYNGQPNQPGNFIMYWTAVNPANTAADALTITSVVNSLSGLNPLSSVSTPFMLGNQARSKNGNFLGSIDEVRISRIARGPSSMLFSLGNVALTPLANQFVPVGSTVTLAPQVSGSSPITYQWLLNGSNITALTAPNIAGYTNSALIISNITFAEAGTYQLIASNSVSSSNVSAVIQVGSVIPGLANTGVDANGALLLGGLIDPNWQLVQSADPSYPGPNAIVDSSVPSTYLPDGPNSQWIAPGDNVNNLGGDYEYQTSFYLDSENVTNMQLIINWAADNACSDIILNGVDLALTDNNGYANFSPTVITNNFLAGSNTLVCVVSNATSGGINLTAFRAELSALSGPLAPTAVQLLSPLPNVTVNEFQTATFAVAPFGSGPLSYQWYYGASRLGGQTNRALVLNNVSPAQAGAYMVVVSNSFSTTNATASLTVTIPDTLEWQGLATADWDLSTINWYDTTTSSDVAFSQNLNVLFDNAGSGQPNVSLDVPLSPNAVTVGASSSYTFFGSGSLTGNFNLQMNGPGTLVMDTSNSYTGNTAIQGGTLQVGNNDTSGSLGYSSVSNNAALSFTRADVFTAPNQISGAGSLAMNGSGTLILTGNNTGYSGPITVNSGILTPRNANALGNGASATTVADGAQVYIDQNINVSNQAFILGGTGNNGTGALRKGGAGVTYLSGPISLTDYSGIALDANSSLFLTNAAAITSTNQNFALQPASNAVCTISGAVNLGSGSFNEFGPASGTGTVILTSLGNNWTGGTTLYANTVLQIGDGGADGSIGNGAVTANGTLTFMTSNSFTMNLAVSGSGGFNQSGAGTMTLPVGALSSFSGAIRSSGTGLLLLAAGESLTSGTLTIGGGQADTNALVLTGSNTVSIPISIFPRAFINTITSNTPSVNFADIINLSGTNTVSPPTPITIASGGNLFCLESDSGYLIFNGGITAVGTARDFALQGAASGEVDGPLTQSTGFSLDVYMMGPGRWFLNGTSSYTGVTAISNGTLVVNGSIASSPVTAAAGTLGGIGTLTGPVVIAAGATLAPTLATGSATPLGTLTINNSLTLAPGSATALQLNKSTASNDKITGLTSVAYGGTLSVSNIAGTLASGDAFPIFSATAYSGSFSSITPATPGAGLQWNLSTLATDGTLRVTNAVVTRPDITSAKVSGGALIFSGTGGQANGSFVLLSSTNAAASRATWTRVSTNTFDGSGNFSVTNGIGSSRASFFTLELQ